MHETAVCLANKQNFLLRIFFVSFFVSLFLSFLPPFLSFPPLPSPPFLFFLVFRDNIQQARPDFSQAASAQLCCSDWTQSLLIIGH